MARQLAACPSCGAAGTAMANRLNHAQRAVLTQYLRDSKQSSGKLDFEAIAREVDGLQGGRPVNSKTVRYWFWRPSGLVGAGSCSRGGRAQERSLPHTAVPIKRKKGPEMNMAQKSILVKHFEEQSIRTVAEYSAISAQIDNLEGGKATNAKIVEVACCAGDHLNLSVPFSVIASGSTDWSFLP